LPFRVLQNFYFRNLIAIGLITGGYAFYLLPQFLSIGGVKGFCMFRSITGVPCPGCGMGKASVLISQGDFWGAFLMNPLAIPFALAAISAIIWLTIDLIRKKESFLPLMTRRLKWPYFLVLLLIIGGVWVWNIMKDL
jgi:hypothetical protein